MMNIKVSKDKLNSRWVDGRISSMLDEIASKTMYKDKEGDQQMKKSKRLNEVTLIEKISKNLQIFLKINPMQEEALPSHKLQDHAYK